MYCADDIVVVEDFLSLEYQDTLQRVIENSEFPLYYNTHTVTEECLAEQSKSSAVDYPQFTHLLYTKDQNKSSWWGMFEPIHFFFIAKTGAVKKENLIRCKLNLNTKTIRGNDEHYAVHKDYEELDLITAIYYVNDADGDTFFFDKSGNKIIKRISPKQGTMVYFNNQIFHAGQAPMTSNYRSVINFNWSK